MRRHETDPVLSGRLIWGTEEGLRTHWQRLCWAWSGWPRRMFSGKAVLKGLGASKEISRPPLPPSAWSPLSLDSEQPPPWFPGLTSSPSNPPAPGGMLLKSECDYSSLSQMAAFSIMFTFLTDTKAFGNVLCPPLPPPSTLPSPLHLVWQPSCTACPCLRIPT